MIVQTTENAVSLAQMPESWNLPDGPLADYAALTEDLVDTARVIFLVLDTGGKVLHINSFMEQLCGYSCEEVRGRDWFDTFITAEESPAVKTVFDRAVGGQSTVGNVNSIVTRNGEKRLIEWFDRPLNSQGGELLGLLVVGRDVTEQAEVEAQLRDAEERATAVMETAVNAIITMDESRTIQSVNSAAEELFGYGEQEMLGQNVSMLMPAPYSQEHDRYVKRYLETGRKKIIGVGREVVGQRKDGTVFPIDLSVGEARLSDGSRLFTGIIRDLTQRKRLEEKILEISEEEQRRIGSDIHDDLCQQLAGIGCLAQVLQQRLADDGSSEVAEEMSEIVKMVSDANARAREMSRGLVPIIRESDGLASALGSLADRTGKLFGIACQFSSPRPVFLTDIKVATQLYRIAQEAVSNACRHSGATRIQLVLEKEGDELLLTVRDNGEGFAEGRNDAAGLGLLTMEHRAKMLGGQLEVRTEDGDGTAVVCRVRLAELEPGGGRS